MKITLASSEVTGKIIFAYIDVLDPVLQYRIGYKKETQPKGYVSTI